MHKLLLVLFLVFSSLAQAQMLFIKGQGNYYFEASEMLESDIVRDFEMTRYPGVKKKMTLKAIPLKKLLRTKKAKDHVVIFQALDGFITVVPLSLAIGENRRTQAHIAIDDGTWPNLPNQDVSAGPFYVVWENPSYGKVGKEWWAYRMNKIIVKESLLSAYPKLYPFKKTNKKYVKGMEIFVKNCFSCHSMNNSGGRKMGPDLVLPMGPTEYFKLSALKKYIRNPESVRQWDGMKMPGFSKADISDKELDLLLDYMSAMTKVKGQD
jgi:hypothetical protein